MLGLKLNHVSKRGHWGGWWIHFLVGNIGDTIIRKIYCSYVYGFRPGDATWVCQFSYNHTRVNNISNVCVHCGYIITKLRHHHRRWNVNDCPFSVNLTNKYRILHTSLRIFQRKLFERIIWWKVTTHVQSYMTCLEQRLLYVMLVICEQGLWLFMFVVIIHTNFSRVYQIRSIIYPSQ